MKPYFVPMRRRVRWAVLAITTTGPLLALAALALQYYVHLSMMPAVVAIVSLGTSFLPAIGCILLIILGPGRAVRLLAAFAPLLVIVAIIWARSQPLVSDVRIVFISVVVVARLMAILAAIIAVIQSPVVLREGFCAHCGYNLTGNVSGVCPECGAPIPDDPHVRRK